MIFGIVLVLRTSGLISPAPRHWHGPPSPLLSAIHIIAEIQSSRVDPDGQSTTWINISGKRRIPEAAPIVVGVAVHVTTEVGGAGIDGDRDPTPF